MLDDLPSVDPTLTVDTVGTYVAQLIVDDGTEPSLPVSPSLSWDDGASRLIQLVANDGSADSAPTTLFISGNNRPVADAGEDLAVLPGAVVTLDGAGSADVDDDSLTFRWAMLAAPEDSASALSDPTAMQPTFRADVPGTYVVQLIVNDGTLDSLPGTVKVAATNVSPPDDATSAEPATAQDGASPDPTASIASGTTMASSELSTIYAQRRETPALAVASTLTSLASSAPVPAFDDCEGAGCAATGGRGGQVIEVTNLNDSGTGSLRACVQASEPRTCVFRVGGTITLNSTLQIVNPFITIAGQTAPGGGILLRLNSNYTGNLLMQVGTHDVIIRYLRIRPGFASCGGDCRGALQVINGGDVYNVVIDHNSLSWSMDENIGVWRHDDNALHHVTLSWNLQAEGLANHSTSFLTGGSNQTRAGGVVDIDLHHSLLMSSQNRNPIVKIGGMKVINNIVYNYLHCTMDTLGGPRVDLIGNWYRPGPGSPSLRTMYIGPSASDGAPGTASVYIAGNRSAFQTDPDDDNWANVHTEGSNNCVGLGSQASASTYRRMTPLSTTAFPITVSHVDDIEEQIIPTVGASRRLNCDGSWIMNRDAVDVRLINQYQTGGGIISAIANESQVGGFPTIASGTPCTDADHDGMPDRWEVANGLDPKDSADRNGDLDGDGHTNLEEFLNGRSAGGGRSSPAPTESLSADPTSIAAGESSTLSWSSTDATSCEGTNFSTGGAVAGAESVPPSADTTYTLDCTGAGGEASDSATVTVTAAGPAPADLPVSLTGSPPEEASVTIEVSRPPDADQATLSMVVNDADVADEGELFINDNGPLALFGDQVGGDGATVTTTYTTPASWWQNGTNTLRFRRTATVGYRVEFLEVSFTGNDGTTTACAASVLDVSSARSDGGRAWLLRGDYGSSADNSSNPARSTLRLFEDDTELGPAHSLHRDTRNLGRGRFSHWSNVDGTGEALRFASSDNSDPRRNRRTYTVCTGGSTTTAAR